MTGVFTEMGARGRHRHRENMWAGQRHRLA